MSYRSHKPRAANYEAGQRFDKKRSSSPPLPPGWSRWFTTDGKPYFYHGDSKNRTWKDPRNMSTAELFDLEEGAGDSRRDDRREHHRSYGHDDRRRDCEAPPYKAQRTDHDTRGGGGVVRGGGGSSSSGGGSGSSKPNPYAIQRSEAGARQQDVNRRPSYSVSDRDRFVSTSVREAKPFTPTSQAHSKYHTRQTERDDTDGEGSRGGGGGGGLSIQQKPHPELFHFKTLLHPGVQLRFDSMFSWDRMSRSDVDQRALEKTSRIHPAVAMEILDMFAEYDLQQVQNKSAFLTGMLKRHGQKEPRPEYIKIMNELPSDAFFSPETQAILDSIFSEELLERAALDQTVLDQLSKVSDDAAAHVLQTFKTKLQSLAGSVRNPAALLTSLISHEGRRGGTGGGGGSGGGSGSGDGSWRHERYRTGTRTDYGGR